MEVITANSVEGLHSCSRGGGGGGGGGGGAQLYIIMC